MEIVYKKVVRLEELADCVPQPAGATWAALWQIFYYTRLFKYVRREHLIQIKPHYNKICTEKNLKKFCRLGYFKSPQLGIYCATDKVLPYIKEAGFITEILPKETEGKGDTNELNNTDVLIHTLKVPNFYALLFPQFKRSDGRPYLKPDALLVQRNEIKRRYKLTFLEVEAKKSDWEYYLNQKRESYLKLAEDSNFYNYWSSVCPHLGFPKPDIESLSFSVCVVGNIKEDLGKGFRFVQYLYR